ncbi:MAG: hypothetical protein KAI66_10580, partial [Lentisphaeria bacterium]|nr:hypothetical protein [Lentisphaeria bacterium]
RFETLYRAWAAQNNVTLPDETIDFTKNTDELIRFFVHVHHTYYEDMERYLRDEVGVRIPMTGSNWSRNAALLAALAKQSFTDSHGYWNHPGKDGTFRNTPMVGASRTVMDSLGFNRMAGKPFFVSEWDEPWPNEWRAELPLAMAAVAAYQAWNGLTVYTYRHSANVPIDKISGAFETFNDPARFGLFPAAALLYRRGDLESGKAVTRIRIPMNKAVSASSPNPWNSAAYTGLSEVRRYETVLGDAPDAVSWQDDNGVPSTRIRENAEGTMRRDLDKRIGVIDTPRSQAVWGFLRDAGTLKSTDLEIHSDTLFATIVLSSLTDQPLRSSSKLLLTAVGRAENTGMSYNALRNRCLSGGMGPILVDPVQARIRFRTDKGLTITPLAADGTRGTSTPIPSKNDIANIQIGASARTIYYLLETR